MFQLSNGCKFLQSTGIVQLVIGQTFNLTTAHLKHQHTIQDKPLTSFFLDFRVMIYLSVRRRAAICLLHSWTGTYRKDHQDMNMQPQDIFRYKDVEQQFQNLFIRNVLWLRILKLVSRKFVEKNPFLWDHMQNVSEFLKNISLQVKQYFKMKAHVSKEFKKTLITENNHGLVWQIYLFS